MAPRNFIPLASPTWWRGLDPIDVPVVGDRPPGAGILGLGVGGVGGVGGATGGPLSGITQGILNGLFGRKPINEPMESLWGDAERKQLESDIQQQANDWLNEYGKNMPVPDLPISPVDVDLGALLGQQSWADFLTGNLTTPSAYSPTDVLPWTGLPKQGVPMDVALGGVPTDTAGLDRLLQALNPNYTQALGDQLAASRPWSGITDADVASWGTDSANKLLDDYAKNAQVPSLDGLLPAGPLDKLSLGGLLSKGGTALSLLGDIRQGDWLGGALDAAKLVPTSTLSGLTGLGANTLGNAFGGLGIANSLLQGDVAGAGLGALSMMGPWGLAASLAGGLLLSDRETTGDRREGGQKVFNAVAPTVFTDLLGRDPASLVGPWGANDLDRNFMSGWLDSVGGYPGLYRDLIDRGANIDALLPSIQNYYNALPEAQRPLYGHPDSTWRGDADAARNNWVDQMMAFNNGVPDWFAALDPRAMGFANGDPMPAWRQYLTEQAPVYQIDQYKGWNAAPADMADLVRYLDNPFAVTGTRPVAIGSPVPTISNPGVFDINNPAALYTVQPFTIKSADEYLRDAYANFPGFSGSWTGWRG